MTNGGGTEHMTQLVANALCQREDYRVFVLSKSANRPIPYYNLDSRITFDVLDQKPYRGAVSLLKDILLLKKYISRNDIHILVNVDVSLGTFSLPMKILRPRLKQVFWEHFCVHYSVGNKRMDSMRRQALKWGDMYVTLTPEDAEILNGNSSCRARVISIPNICPYQISAVPYDSESKTIISVGNTIPVKGMEYIIEAAKTVFLKHPDWKWEIYGDGSRLNALKKQVSENALLENVFFRGRDKNLMRKYRESAFLVMTSKSEGFGMALAEAQAFHLPTVAFDVPYGPRNIITDGVNGYLIPPFDTEAMSEKICELIENRALRKSFSEHAADDLDVLSSESVLLQWVKMLEELV